MNSEGCGIVARTLLWFCVSEIALHLGRTLRLSAGKQPPPGDFPRASRIQIHRPDWLGSAGSGVKSSPGRRRAVHTAWDWTYGTRRTYDFYTSINPLDGGRDRHCASIAKHDVNVPRSSF